MKNLLVAALQIVAGGPEEDPNLKNLVKDEINKLTKSSKMKELIEKMALRYNIDKQQATKILFEQLGSGLEESLKKTAASFE